MDDRLVTVAGGGGFIGGHLVADLRCRGITRIRAVDIKPQDQWYQCFDDVENLRLHYARTLKQWLGRFESAAETVRDMFDRRFVRMWRLYLSGSLAAFTTGALQLFQIVFARPQVNDIPPTRSRLYA